MAKATAPKKAILRKLQAQSAQFAASPNITGRELVELASALRLTGPRARRVIYKGISFPLRWSLSATYAACPETGRLLVGRLDI